MKKILKLEELAMVFAGVVAFNFLPFEWWWFLILFLAPDFGMVGYAFGNKAGALSYNLFHHKGIAVTLGIAGIYMENEFLQLAGVILFSHAAFDRMLGYGLKYRTGFHFTHLGVIGKGKGADGSKEGA